jgi:hypothetical protein
MRLELACFISPHGYGHATRTIALLQSLQKRLPDLQARLFTTAPESIFRDTAITYTYHRMTTDVGLVQRDAFSENRAATVKRLAELLPFSDLLISHCAELCRGCRLIICDISCLGILAAKAAEIPSVLVENFTWDWIYKKMGPESGLEPFIDYFSDIYKQVDQRIQTRPVCAPQPCARRCLPIARRPQRPRRLVRESLADENRKIVLVSMGGGALDLPFIDRLENHPDYLFILAGQKEDDCLGSNVRLLGPASGLHHPDLINAADLLICKSGYSTIAECLQTTTPICCVAREHFGESEILENFVKNEMNGAVIDAQNFFSGNWLTSLDNLMLNNRPAAEINGADQAAEFIASLLPEHDDGPENLTR